MVYRALVVFFAYSTGFLVVEATRLERPEVKRAAVGLGVAVFVRLAVFIDIGTLALNILIADVRAALGRFVALAAREELLRFADDFFATGGLSLFFNR